MPTAESRLPRFAVVLLTRYYTAVAALMVAGVAGWQMYSLYEADQLWGVRPLLLLLGCWVATVVLRQAPARVELLAWGITAGLLLGIGFAPYGAIWAPVLGFACLLTMVRRSVDYDVSKKQALWYGYNAMVFFNVVSTWWVANTALAAGVVANFLNAFLQALVVLLVYLAARRLPRYWLAAAVAFWLGFEYLHFNWQIAWPWLCLGHTFAPAPTFAQWFSWTGVFGGSLYVTAVGACAYPLLYAFAKPTTGAQTGYARRTALRLVAVAGLPLLASAIAADLLEYEYPSRGEVRVAAVQPNYEPHYRKFEVGREAQLAHFERLTEEALSEGAALVVYPETSFGGVEEGSLAREPFYGMWRSVCDGVDGAALLTGLSSYRRLSGPSDDPALRTQTRPGGKAAYYIAHNSAVAFSAEAPPQIYYKSKLVPGVEFLPYRRLLFFFEPLVASLGGTTAGLGRSERAVVFELPGGVTAAPLICYESIYGDYVRQFIGAGANLLVVPTNDGWWDDSPGYRQHFNLARLRAIETRRWVVQAANSGTSGFIDPLGRAYAKTDYDVAAVTSYDVSLESGETFYVRSGDLLGRLASLASVVFLVGIALAKRTG